MLDRLRVDQPRWAHLTDLAEADALVEELGGYPVLVRPSYVLERRGHERGQRAPRAGAHLGPRIEGLARASGRRLEVREPRPGGRVRRGRRRRAARALGDQRARRERRRALGRRDPGPAAADALHRDHSAHQEDRRRGGARARDHRSLQHAVPGAAQRGQGDRVQSARLAQLSLRLQGDRVELRRRGHAAHAGGPAPGHQQQPRSGLRGGQGAPVLLRAPERGGSHAGRRDGEHRRGRLLRRRPARGDPAGHGGQRLSDSRTKACCCPSARSRTSTPWSTRSAIIAEELKLPIYATEGTAEALDRDRHSLPPASPSISRTARTPCR